MTELQQSEFLPGSMRVEHEEDQVQLLQSAKMLGKVLLLFLFLSPLTHRSR